MLSTLSIVYLFAGGVGAGALVIACCVDLFAVKEPFVPGGVWADSSFDAPNPTRRVAARVFLVSWGLVLFGALCLAADLGRVDRIQMLFTSPTASMLSLGAYTLAFLILIGGALVAVRLLQLRHIGRTGVVMLEVATMVAGLVMVVYTGFLLRQMVGVALWNTWLTPVLFALSSISGGCGLVALIVALAESDDPFLPSSAMLLRVDSAFIAAELVFAGIFLARVLSVANSSMAASRALLLDLTTDTAQLWWLGFMLVGMAVPLILELVAYGRSRDTALRGEEQAQLARAKGLPLPATSANASLRRLMAVCGAAVLVGALCFRFAVAGAGSPRVLELMDVDAAPSAGAVSVLALG